jgi:hypothetical protein
MQTNVTEVSSTATMIITHFLNFGQLIKEENFGWKGEDMQMAWLMCGISFLPSEGEKQVINEM